jgi:hypothetical protein
MGKGREIEGVRVCITEGRWYLNWGGLAHSNGWTGINGMVSNTSNTVSMCLIPFYSLNSSHYYELSSPQQPPVACMHAHLNV